MAGTPAAAVVEQQVEQTNEEADADFDAGFEAPLPAETKPSEPVKPAAQAPVKVEVPAKPAPAAKPAVAAAPKYVQITQEELDGLKAAAAKTATFDQRLKDTVGGHIGELEQRIIRKLQAATPAGLHVDLPADVVAELDKEFPEIAKGVRSSLEKALKGVRGTAPTVAAADKAADPEVFKTLFRTQRQADEFEDLVDDHPTWRDVVGKVDAEGKYDPDNKFRQWLATQPVDYQKLINDTQRPAKIRRAINRFLASSFAKPTAAPAAKPPAPKVVVRNERFRGAIQPKGDGGPVAPTKPAEDDFDRGFREESRTG